MGDAFSVPFILSWLDSCCESSDFLFRATCVIIRNSFSQNNSPALKAKIPVRAGVRSAIQATQSWFG